MRFLRPDNERLELTYNDVFLLPQYSDIPSRMDVDVAPVSKINLQIPIVLSNMTSVAGRRMAETVARRGGLVVFTQDASFDRIEKMVAFVKKANIKYDTPIILKETDTIQTALNLILKRAHKAVIIVDDENHPIGIFKEKDKDDKDLFTLMKDVMSRELITIPEDLAPKEIFYILDKHRLSIAPVVDKENKLVGVITKKGAVRLSMYNPAVNENNQLLTAVAVRAGGDVEQSVNRLLEIGVDVIVVDTAHGHQKKMIEAVKGARRMAGNDFPIVAGNVVTQEGAQALIDAGASIVKVGVGPGAVCTTRMMTGVGRPQFSAVHRVAQIARKQGVGVWADGGVRYPRDVALAIAAGATSVMIGSWFAGTYESPADAHRDSHGRIYKEQFGMASHRAVIRRGEGDEKWMSARKEFFKEGASNARMYLKEGMESAEDIIDSIIAGLRSACTYSGARNLQEFYDKAIIGVQTPAGYNEGKSLEHGW